MGAQPYIQGSKHQEKRSFLLSPEIKHLNPWESLASIFLLFFVDFVGFLLRVLWVFELCIVGT